MYFRYGSKEITYLSAADPILGVAIAHIGRLDRQVMPDLFEALIDAIAGQQISGKAKETVWARLCTALGEVTPEAVQRAGEDGLRACGLSGRKAKYMLAAAEAFQTGALEEESLRTLDDEAFIQTMTALPGVGRWTAEMLLVFSLQRPDVLAYDDFGIRKGLCLLYGLPEVTKEQFAVYRKRYSPYATVAGLYLWAVAGGAAFR